MTADRELGSLTVALDRIESALQRAPVMCASPVTWIAEEGEPAMAALRLIREVCNGIPGAVAQAAVIGAKHAKVAQ